MSRKIFGAAWVLLSLLSVSGLVLLTRGTTAAEEKDAPKEVICKGNTFRVGDKEQPLTIKVGDSVVWVNKDDADHDATPKKSSPAKFAAVEIPKNSKSKPVKFTKAGT